MATKQSTRSVVCAAGRLPDWMIGPESSSESSDSEEDDGGLPYWLKKDSYRSYPKEDGQCVHPPEMSPSSSPSVDEENFGHLEDNEELEEEEKESSDAGSVKFLNFFLS